MVTSESSGVDASELRRRLPQQPATAQHANSTEAAQEAVSDLNADEKASDKPEEDKRAFGRTPDGTGTLDAFTVFPLMACRTPALLLSIVQILCFDWFLLRMLANNKVLTCPM